MEDLIRCYQKLIRLLEEEDEKIALSLQGPYLEQYRKILRQRMHLLSRGCMQAEHNGGQYSDPLQSAALHPDQKA